MQDKHLQYTETDYLIIGSGIAGITAALRASETGSVLLITKRTTIDSNSNYAQGGIASVMSDVDTFEDHISDTMICGADLCHESVVETIVRSGPDAIRKLMDYGVEFSKRPQNKTELDLGKEGGHSHRRIIHAGDITGHEVKKVLIQRLLERPNVTVKEYHSAVDLITSKKVGHNKENTVLGAYVLDIKNHQVITIKSKVTILASGGAGKVYLYTTNPDVATGDGIAMAYRAGARIKNLEFVQFHPTCLYHHEAKSFLISEAVRGEGAVLRLKDGSSFMEKYHPMGSLAPRDIVARAIDFEMKRTGDDCVYLDITAKSKSFIQARFPNIYTECLKFGIDMSTGYIPVVPAAHYFCGGVASDLFGRTNLKNLFVCGEVACTGLHGANRLASNSLLEALVMASNVVDVAQQIVKTEKPPLFDLPHWNTGKAVDSDETVIVSHNWDEIRRFMWNYVGIVRSNKRLERAKRRIDILKQEIDEYYWDFVITNDLIELRNIATVAELIIQFALHRKESRGLHYNIDYPESDNEWLEDSIYENGKFLEGALL
ncbi:L-aspartate oxidase [bacterium]|nr:L-aspartate oxidase [bacterium]MCP5462899.1 L-aspartate oxidase [bacterium]